MTARRGLAALQEVHAGLHAVVYGYGVAGARLRGAQRQRAAREWNRHRARRDELAAVLTDLGAEPAQAAVAYELPFATASARDALVLVTVLEERLAAVWADAVPTLRGELRGLAVTGLREAAVAAARWRGGSVPFPGLAERAADR